jgi:hypothetical protein
MSFHLWDIAICTNSDMAEEIIITIMGFKEELHANN